MRNREPFAIVTFHTTAEAMATEKACKENGIEGRLISTPRVLSADCGISWKSPVLLKKELEELLKIKEIEYAGIAELEL
ncbi:MAG: DUF3343 domain-containing protein [Lachnospiraceae bacterium]|nr:DUF3343 domain-containing protein [Lachnospiraceae bacterium]